MKYVISIFLVFSLFFVDAQEIETKFIDSVSLKADEFIGVDTFENYYYTIGNTLFKKSNNAIYNFTNTQLGTITSVDITNPLKILVFYQDFNTVVILDNRLNELSDQINFATTTYGKNVAALSISSSNNLWLYSLDDNVLTLWNYKSKKTIFESQPLSFYSNDFESTYQMSNYQFCWLISNEGFLQFNEFGNFMSYTTLKVKNIQPYINGYVYVADDKLYFKDAKGVDNELLIAPTNHKLDTFYIVNHALYFFNRNVIHKYSLLKK